MDFSLGSVFSVSVALLQDALELLTVTVDLGQIVVCKLTPLFFYFAGKLLPIAFDTIPVHARVSFCCLPRTCGGARKFQGMRTTSPFSSVNRSQNAATRKHTADAKSRTRLMPMPSAFACCGKKASRPTCGRGSVPVTRFCSAPIARDP